MAHRNPVTWLAALLLLSVACGGEEPPPGIPAEQPEGAAQRAGTAGLAVDSPQVEQSVETELVREVFSYRGAGRDPFLSLIRTGDVRPLLGDLRVTNIVYNERYPSNSVAVLRDTSAACVQSPTGGCRYTVQVGDVLGRLTVAEIRRQEVVVVYEEFGEERQRVLRLRRSQEETR